MHGVVTILSVYSLESNHFYSPSNMSSHPFACRLLSSNRGSAEPTLPACLSRLVGMTGVHELVAANWPALSVLFIDMTVDMGILSLLFQARWPKLAFLSLYTERLPSTQKGMEQESLIVSALSNGWSKMVSYLEQPSSSSSATSANRFWIDPCAMLL